MLKVRLKILFASATAAFLLGAPLAGDIQAATIDMSPANASFERGCVRSVAVEIDATAQSSNAADVEITFDPTQVTIIDSNPSVPGVQIIPGSAYESYFYNQVNQGTGVIRVAAGSFVGTLTSRRLFATIEFTTSPSATATAFNIDFDGVGVTLDSNVADATTSQDLLSGVTNGSYTFVSGPCSADTQGPNIVFVSPTSGQIGVAANSQVTIRVTDNQSGVDLSSLAFVINGITYTIASPELSYSGSSLNYLFTITPSTPFPVGSASTIAVQASDAAGNSRAAQIIFNQPSPPPADIQPPQIQFISPTAFRPSFPANGPLSFRLTDNQSGVDLNSLVINLNGVEYNTSSPELTWTGSSLDYVFTLIPSTPLPTNTYSTLRVTIRDNNGNSNSDYVVFNFVVGPGVPQECEPNEEPENCFGETISSRDVVTVLRDFFGNNNNIDIFAGTILEGTFIDSLFNQVGIGGILAFLLGALLGLNLLNLLSFVNAPGLLLNIFGFYVLRQRNKPWGIVFDAYTGKPIEFAVCRLYVSGTTTVINQTVTDLEGRYGFIISPGAYRLEITQSGYVTHKEEISINKNQVARVADVMLYSEELRAVKNRANFFKAIVDSIKSIYRRALPFIFSLGIGMAFLSLMLVPNLFNLVIVILYMVALAFYLLPKLTGKNTKYAAVIDSSSGLRVPYAVVKIFDTKTWEMVDTQSTNYNGKFDFWVEPGEYAMLVAKRSYKFPSIKNSYPLAESKYSALIIVKLAKGRNNIEVYVDPIEAAGSSASIDRQEKFTEGKNLESPFS